MPPSTPEDLLAELEDVLRTMPPRATVRHRTPENLRWLGRAVAVLGQWDPSLSAVARSHVADLYETMAVVGTQGYMRLMVLLHEAHSHLRFTTVGPVNTAIGQGLVFDYFEEIRPLIELAAADILFVDPYLDAEFVSRYLGLVRSGVSIRLLARERLQTLVPAAKLFAAQNGANIEVRSAPGFHDRYMIVDGSSCFQSGASFKDGGRRSPTTITQITDAFSSVRATYEDLWLTGIPA